MRASPFVETTVCAVCECVSPEHQMPLVHRYRVRPMPFACYCCTPMFEGLQPDKTKALEGDSLILIISLDHSAPRSSPRKNGVGKMGRGLVFFLEKSGLEPVHADFSCTTVLVRIRHSVYCGTDWIWRNFFRSPSPRFRPTPPCLLSNRRRCCRQPSLPPFPSATRHA